MKRIYPLLLLLFTLACSDGELQIETIDFDSVSIQSCDAAPDINSTIFFKVNNAEALILDLQNGILKNEDSDGIIISPVPGSSQVAYRTFSDNVSKAYFCDVIPPVTPTVTEEIMAEGGSVFVTTVQSQTDTTMYEHTVELSGISLVNSNGERITDLSINMFGTFTTQKN